MTLNVPFCHDCWHVESVCSPSKNILTSSALSIIEKSPDRQYSLCFKVLCIPKNNSSFDENTTVDINTKR